MKEEHKNEIDAMTQFELCRRWRFAPIGDELFQGETGDYYTKRLKEMGGFTPEISKALS